jgi:hypothetical protein
VYDIKAPPTTRAPEEVPGASNLSHLRGGLKRRLGRLNTNSTTTNTPQASDRSGYVGVLMPLELKRALQHRAQQDDLTLSSLLRRAAKAWLASEPGES